MTNKCALPAGIDQEFHYFVPRDVYRDDPFTPQIGPSIPFPLALAISNSGFGAANNLALANSQPKSLRMQKAY